MLILKGVSKAYRRGKHVIHALRNLNLEVKEGEALCIMGPSGSGKTTLLKVSAGLLEPDSGEVYLLGEPIYRLPLRMRLLVRRRYVGFMPQEDLLISTLTVLENVELPLMIDGVKEKERRVLALQALEAVGLNGVEDRSPEEVSGGERRRVSLARALVGNPKIIFLDEPTSNLDVDSVISIIKLIFRLNKIGITIITATHDLLVAESFKKIIYIRNGTLSRSPFSEKRGTNLFSDLTSNWN